RVTVLAIAWSIRMRSRRKLRFRLIVTFALFGFGLSALFAYAAVNIRTRVEEQLINSALQDEVDSINAKVRANPAERPPFDIIKGATFSDRTLYKAPLNWQSLETGVHDVYEDGKDGKPRHYKVAVRREDGIISFIQFDVS